VKVNFFATLRQITGQKTVEFELAPGSSMRTLLGMILDDYPLMRPELLDENGNLYQHVHIFINGRDVPYLDDQLDTIVQAEDVVNVFPAVGGG
jgi:molybdopterin synthase sulfur carrier subunit